MSSASASAAASNSNGKKRKVEMVGSTECTFVRCDHPVAKGAMWCEQHVRMLNVGVHAMEKAWKAYNTESIWTQLAQCKTATETEALWAVHCWLQNVMSNQVPIGICYFCDTFSLCIYDTKDESGVLQDACPSCFLREKKKAAERDDRKNEEESD